MTLNIETTKVEISGRDKPYPLRCPECWNPEVWPATIGYDARVRHGGRLHKFHIPDLQVDQCRQCREILFSNTTDRQISDALRAHVGLLQPEEIRQKLAGLGISEDEFAERIGVSARMASDWVEGWMIPSRAEDNLMRMFFQFESVREALSGQQGSNGTHCCETVDEADSGAALELSNSVK
jgi:DNA-binding transcriptional regulator YiaG